MGFFDAISSGLSRVGDWAYDAASDAWSGISDGWSNTGPTQAGPGGGWANRIGTQIGDIAERVAGGYVAGALPMPGGGTTGAGRWGGPMSTGGGRSVESILRSYETDAARANQAPGVYRDTGPTSSSGSGLSAAAPISPPQTGWNYQPREDQIVGAGLPAVIAGSAAGDMLARGAEYAVSAEGQEMIGGLWDLVRGRTKAPGGAPIAANGFEQGQISEQREAQMSSAMQQYQGPGVLPYGGKLFKNTYSGIRANTVVMVRHPNSGEPVFFRHVGKPILFSGDFATARRVDRIAKKAKKSRRGR